MSALTGKAVDLHHALALHPATDEDADLARAYVTRACPDHHLILDMLALEGTPT